jgi:Flp pilus assembly protein TadB
MRLVEPQLVRVSRRRFGAIVLAAVAFLAGVVLLIIGMEWAPVLLIIGGAALVLSWPRLREAERLPPPG